MIVPDLGELANGGRPRSGNESEPVSSRAGRCRRHHFDSRGVLEEIPEEQSVRVWISELHAPCDATPFKMKRVDGGGHNAERVRGVKAVRNGEGVEHGQVRHVDGSFSFAQMNLNTVLRYWGRPEDSIRSYTGIVRMRAQRAR